MPRLAWFTPLPPTRSGIAAYNAELLPRLAARGFDVLDPLGRAPQAAAGARPADAIDVFADPPPAREFSWPHCPAPGSRSPGTGATLQVFSAHDFVWKHDQSPYDLAVYQLGNAACHDFIWPHLARYPGLVVLHDGNLHHERSRALLTRGRLDEYRAEFRYNHPEAPEHLPELIISTLGGSVYYLYPMLRWVLKTARLVAVHGTGLASLLGETYPGVEVAPIGLGVVDPLAAPPVRLDVRARFGIPPRAPLFAAFGLVTPEKRISACLRALARMAAEQPGVRLLLVGGTVPYYDASAEARALGIEDRVHITGYVADEELPAFVAAADVCLCLRWPTSGETSATWITAVAAGKPTVVTDLAHTADVPSLDPRTWASRTPDGSAPVCVSVDVLDEEESLRLAMVRLAADDGLRAEIGRAARARWKASHTMERAVEDYVRVIDQASRRPAPRVRDLPAHLAADHTGLARRLVADFGVTLDVL